MAHGIEVSVKIVEKAKVAAVPAKFIVTVMGLPKEFELPEYVPAVAKILL